ncbi:MAG: DUF1634 domain-containing protein [Nitrospiraceae bacterium]|nr:DUF1634 domain-containing protein [Nitrospiraceae bacterium]
MAGREGKNAWTDKKMGIVIGNLLRTGVLIAAITVAAGGIFYLARQGAAAPHYRVFLGEPADLRSVYGIARDASSLHSRGIMGLGLLLLIATPVARVAFSVLVFALQRDRLYVMVTIIVLAVLIFSLAGGHV